MYLKNTNNHHKNTHVQYFLKKQIAPDRKYWTVGTKNSEFLLLMFKKMRAIWGSSSVKSALLETQKNIIPKNNNIIKEILL